MKNRQIRNSNPLGIKFPKFLSFRNNVVETVFKHKAGVKEKLQRPPMLVQRYIVPDNFQAQVKVVHWRRTKKTKVYTVMSRQALKSRKDPTEPHTANSTNHDFSASAFTVSLHSLWTAAVLKDQGLSDELAEILDILRTTVLRPTLAPGEVMDEVVISLMRGLDRRMYVLPLLRAKVSVTEAVEDSPAAARKGTKSLSLADVLADESVLDRLNCRPMPFLSMSDLRSASHQIYMRHAPLVIPRSITPPHHEDDGGLDSVAKKLDKLKKDGRKLKGEFGVVRKVDLSGYPHAFLGNVINRLLFSVTRDQRLVKFFSLDRDLAQARLDSAVRQTVDRGTSRYLRLRIQKIHQPMGITDRDFELFLRYFTDAMRGEDAADHDISEMASFLNEFRSDVVQAKKDPENLETE